MKKLILYNLILFCTHFSYGQVTVIAEVTTDGNRILQSEDALSREDVVWSVENAQGCELTDKRCYELGAVFAGGKSLGMQVLMLDMSVFQECRPVAEGEEIILEMEVINPSSRYHGYKARKKYLVPRYSVFDIWTGDRAIDLKRPSDLVLSVEPERLTLCKGDTTENLIRLLVSQAENYTISWPEEMVVTGENSNCAKLLFDELTEGGNVLTIYVSDGEKMAMADLRVNVLPPPEKPLIEWIYGRGGRSLSCQVKNQSSEGVVTYQWLVNHKLMQKGSGLFESGGLQDRDVVTCLAEDKQCGMKSQPTQLTVDFAGLSRQMAGISYLVPNLVTPNGDGLNDTWRIDWLDELTGSLVTIYNGQGKVVFQTDHYRNDWEGRIDGKIRYGVYTYSIRLLDGQLLQSWLEVKAK